MQDIPRNELLDKLAAGWTLRRKNHESAIPLQRNVGSETKIRVCDLLKDDWEGEPPGPVCIGRGYEIIPAFKELRDGAKFIRRPNWVQETGFYKQERYTLTFDDILANDWEVWG